MIRATIVLMAVILGVIPFGASIVHAGPFDLFKRHKEMSPVTDKTYLEECGACHFPFQPGWLPARSWRKLLDPKALEDHFGDNAELELSDRSAIARLLERNATEHSDSTRAIKLRRSIKADEAPLRITQTRYINRKHAEIPDRLITGNDEVKSLSNCERCHTEADSGSFDDDTVVIPGYGAWGSWWPLHKVH